MELEHFGFADEGLYSGNLTELVEVVHGSLLPKLRLPNSKLLQVQHKVIMDGRICATFSKVDLQVTMAEAKQ